MAQFVGQEGCQPYLRAARETVASPSPRATKGLQKSLKHGGQKPDRIRRTDPLLFSGSSVSRGAALSWCPQMRNRGRATRFWLDDEGLRRNTSILDTAA